MQRTVRFQHDQMTPVMKLLVVSGYVITAVNTNPVFKSIEGGLQLFVPAVSLAISLLMSLVFKDYDPIRQTVSQMVHYPYGWILTTDFIVVSVWLLILSVKFYFTYARKSITKISSVFLLLSAVGFLLIALFPTSMEGTVKNIYANVHEYTARMVSILFPIACALLLPQLFCDREHRFLAKYTAVTAIFGLALVIICAVVIITGGNTLGLFERLLMANALVWGLVTSIRLFPIIPTLKTG